MKLRPVAAGVLLAAVTTACQLSAGVPTAQPTATPIMQQPSPTFIMPATSTLPVTSTAVSPTSTQRPGGTTCFPRSDWQVYLVQPGDTLNLIAQRAGTTATALALANCLTNANFIQVGQALRVPIQPPTVTRTPSPTPQVIIVTATPTSTVLPPVVQGSVMVSDFISADAANFGLLRGERIVVSWGDSPTNMSDATFYAVPPGADLSIQRSELAGCRCADAEYPGTDHGSGGESVVRF